MNIKIFSGKKAEVKKVKKKEKEEREEKLRREKKKQKKKLSRTYHKSEQILKLSFFPSYLCSNIF